MELFHAELRYEIGGINRDLSHPLNVTTQNVQQNAKHVNATPKFKNIMTSELWSALYKLQQVSQLTITSSAHCGERDLLRTENERESSTCKEKATQGLRRGPRGENRTGRPKPDKEICQAAQDRECDEKVSP
jgi:hypothetical protein